MTSEPTLTFVVPGEHDVLCGRGQVFFQHAGNVHFRGVIARSLPDYARAETKSEKTCFVRKVVSEISSQGGRFLKLDKASNKWYEGDSVCAKSKVGHAFRDAIAEPHGRTSSESDEWYQEQRVDSGSESDSHDTEVSAWAPALLLRKSAEKADKDSRTTTEDVKQQKEPAQTKPDRANTKPRCEATESVEQAILKTFMLHQHALARREQNRSPATAFSSSTIESIPPISCTYRPPSEDSWRKAYQDVLSAYDEGRTPVEALSSSTIESNISTKFADDSVEKKKNPGSHSRSEDHRDPPGFIRTSGPSITRRSVLSNPASMPPLGLLQPMAHQVLSGTIDTKKYQDTSATNTSRCLPLPAPVPSAPTGQATTAPNFMLPSTQRRLQRMVDARELKIAMYHTLALRQQALEQNGTKQDLSKENGGANVVELIERAKATRPSSSEILKQAMAVVQTNSFAKCTYGASRNKMSKRVLGVQGKATNADKELTTNRPQKQSNRTKDAKVTVPAKKEPSAEKATVTPDCLKNLSASAAILLGLQGTKRQRSFASSDFMDLPKRRVSLAQVASEYTVQSQESSGPCFPYSAGAVDARRLYFL